MKTTNRSESRGASLSKRRFAPFPPPGEKAGRLGMGGGGEAATINVALIGVTGFAAVHYRDVMNWREQGRIRIVAATVVNQEMEKEKCDFLREIGCEIFDDSSGMLADWDHEIDLCIIPTGIHLHKVMTLAALEAGCNILLEKPAAATIQEVDAMIAAAEAAGKFVAVGYQHMYTPEVAAIKKAIRNGLIGEVECIKCVGLWPRMSDYYLRNNWAGRLSLESGWVLDAPFNNAFAHWLNLLCFLAGSEPWVSAVPRSIRAELYRARLIESADTSCLQIDTECGIPLYLWVTHSCPDSSDPVLEVRGTKGSLVWTSTQVTLRTAEQDSVFMRTSTSDECRKLMYQAILSKVEGGESFICDLEIARNQTLCANGAFESSSIHPIPSQYLTTTEEAEVVSTSINGIADLCRKAFVSEKLWSEMEVAWAGKPTAVDLDHYTAFHSPGRAAVPI